MLLRLQNLACLLLAPVSAIRIPVDIKPTRSSITEPVCTRRVALFALTAIPAAIIKASTALMQAQVSEGGQLSSEAVVALQDHLDRYYDRLELAPASKSFSKVEWDVLEDREREARMRTLGMSKSLAKALIEGQRDVGRPRRDAGPELTELRESVKAIKSLVEGLKDHAS